MTTIVIAEDDELQAELARRYLTREGFETTVVADGRSALEAVRSSVVDLLVLDVMLPQMDGFAVCRALRAAGDETPILMLTARSEEDDLLVGLELGADDYVTKPYSFRELLARVRAVLRRRQPASTVEDEDSPELFGAGPVQMDVDRHVVTVRGELVSLPLKEFDLLEFLLRNAGRVLTRGQLIDRVWGSDYVGDTKTLDVHVKRLRAKIEVDPASPELLQTVRGLGYKLVDD